MTDKPSAVEIVQDLLDRQAGMTAIQRLHPEEEQALRDLLAEHDTRRILLESSTEALHSANDRAEAAEKRAQEAEENYRFMVERAADEKLDGYRELGARAAAAENAADRLRQQRDGLVRAVEGDAAGESVVILLVTVAHLLSGRGGGPVADRCRLAADAIDAALAAAREEGR